MPQGIKSMIKFRTIIYTHVSNKDIGKIKSPLDNSQMKGGKEG